MKLVLKKGIVGANAAPYFSNLAPGSKGGIFTGAVGAGSTPHIGPRGGHIKAYSPTTGRPVYFKPWESGQGYSSHEVVEPSAGKSAPGNYQVYERGSIIGKTSNGQPVYAGANINDTKDYLYSDHRDAHMAHFSLAQYVKALIAKREAEKEGSAGSLHGVYEAHMNFARHHQQQALLELLHDRQKRASEEDLSKREQAAKKSKPKGVETGSPKVVTR